MGERKQNKRSRLPLVHLKSSSNSSSKVSRGLVLMRVICGIERIIYDVECEIFRMDKMYCEEGLI